MSEERHPLYEARRARARKIHEFDIRDLVGLGGLDDWAGKPLEKIAIRVATKVEQDAACDAATAYAEKRAKNAANDPDVLLDAKSAAMVATCYRDLKRPDVLPVWPSVEEVCRLLTADQISALISLYNQVRQAESPNQVAIEPEDLDAIVNVCVASAGTDFPEAQLARVERVRLEQMFILLAIRLREAESKIVQDGD